MPALWTHWLLFAHVDTIRTEPAKRDFGHGEPCSVMRLAANDQNWMGIRRRILDPAVENTKDFDTLHVTMTLLKINRCHFLVMTNCRFEEIK